MIQTKTWHKLALEQRGYGLGSRRIAKNLGLGKTTVNDFFKKYDEWLQNEYEEATPEFTQKRVDGPRILVYDIETSPLIAHLWSMWQQGVGLNQIQSDWFIMSFAAKWLGEDEIFYYDQRDAIDMQDDSYILSKLWEMLNEADIVIGQNIKKFDTKKVNARFILNGFPKPAVYRQIDTMVIAKEQFGFTSNKLEYLAKNLCPDHVKSKHNEYPGHEMWVECLKGNQHAWQCMEDYNKDDILATEALYNMLSSWDSKLPNFDVYIDGPVDMSDWVFEGKYHVTNLAKYKLYRNVKTGQQRRSRVNELTKEKRQQLLGNV